MLKGEQVLCGTTTTGIGTLTLAATPVPPGGVDFDVMVRATPLGNPNGCRISYTIIEYTDRTFATQKQMEKGDGILLIGAVGIANCTLARTTPQVTATSMNSQPATYNTRAPSAISIGVAVNTLVFISASASDLFAAEPCIQPGMDVSSGHGILVPNAVQAAAGDIIGSGNDYYVMFELKIPLLVKRAYVRVDSTVPTGTTNAYFRIYDMDGSAAPRNLLIDLGQMGTAGSALNTANTVIATALHATGIYLTPGQYFYDFYCIYSTGSCVMTGFVQSQQFEATPLGCTTTMAGFWGYVAVGGGSTTAPAIANTNSLLMCGPTQNKGVPIAALNNV